MVKRLIFDLDNTLIIWKKEYIKATQDAIKSFNLKIDVDIVDNIINDLEKNCLILTKEQLLKDINKICNTKLDMDFVDSIFDGQKLLAEPNDEVINTLEYLSKKYELVVLTNYFEEVQRERLKVAKIDKYFKYIYAGDKVCQKPDVRGFEEAIGSNKKEECIMIGDNYNIDILGALNFGISAIACDYFNKIPCSNKYQKITKFGELKNIL